MSQNLAVRTEPLAVLSDAPDNRILECAVAADAQAIVTGDRLCSHFVRIEESGSSPSTSISADV